jgi:intergrase/recombinase
VALADKMMAVMGNPSYHSGANDERTAILAKVRRMVKTQPTDGTDVYINGTELVKWLLQRNERYKKNPGGL